MFSNLFGITKTRPWNQRRLLGQKPPLKLKEVWAIRIHLQLAGKLRDLALFNLAIDSKLRACDLIRLRVQDVCHSDRIVSRAVVIQQKTHRPVQFEVTEQTRSALSSWIHHRRLQEQDCVFPSRIKSSPHLSRRQYARLLSSWLANIGLDPSSLWHAFAQAHEGVANLPTHEESPGGSTAPGAHQTRKHGAIPRH